MKVKLLRPVYCKFGIVVRPGVYEAERLDNRFRIKVNNILSVIVESKKVGMAV